MQSWYYFFNPTTPDASEGTMHLVSVDDYCRRVDDQPILTLCRRDVSGMENIDETASGYLVTCKSCRSSAGIGR